MKRFRALICCYTQISPVSNVKAKRQKRTDEQPTEEISHLTLAPFTPNPKIFFENVLVNTTAIKKLLIDNPSDVDVSLKVCANFPDDLPIDLSWKRCTLEGKSNIILEISWTPKCELSGRYTLHVDDGHKIKRDVFVTCKSINPKISPVSNVKAKRQKRTDEQPTEEISHLTLAPFTPNPKIFFENVLVNTTAIKKLLIDNPSDVDVSLKVCANFPDDLPIDLSWKRCTLEGKSNIILEISWTPKCELSGRYTLHVDDGHKIKRDVFVTCKSINPKKQNSKNLPTFVANRVKSPIYKSPKRKLFDITNIPQIFCERKDCTETIDRRGTYTDQSAPLKSPVEKLIRQEKERREYLQLRQAAICVQRRFRAKLLARKEKSTFDELRATAIVIQRRYKATMLMKVELHYYEILKQTTILVQRRFRAKVAMKLQRLKFTQLQTARHQAATKIQSVWRGYSLRSRQGSDLCEMRKRCLRANSNAAPEKTLGFLAENASELLVKESDGLSIHRKLKMLKNLEFATRRSAEICQRLSVTVIKCLYATALSLHRSPPEIEARTLAVEILINVFKFPSIQKRVWQPDYIEDLFIIMNHFVDKEDRFFPAMCTLLWLFAHIEQYKAAIANVKECGKKMWALQEACSRKARMVANQKVCFNSRFEKVKHLPLPSLKTDWGLENKKHPKMFHNSLYALTSLKTILGFN